MIMDVNPWAKGQGFASADQWWAYVQRQSERNRLELLLTAALVSTEVARLLLAHDRALLARFDLSQRSVNELADIEAESLVEFAQKLVDKLGRR